MAIVQTDLAVRGESVQRLYNYFVNERFIVNRRYQRKLVWTIEEKQAFIDSIRQGLPVPLILVAETKLPGSPGFEIIDGMQRLNSIAAFIENEFPIDGGHFDLETLAETKLRQDNGLITQNSPKLERRSSTDIANYTVPLSVYKAVDQEQIDEVFRRINSNGRYLSRQELRQAGVKTGLSELVRRLAARIRGDVSASDQLPLNKMAEISITSRDLKYGIKVDDVFWVKQGILTREHVRESRDEEIIAELVAAMVLDSMPSSGTQYMDEFYGFRDSGANRSDLIEQAIQARTPELIESQFMSVFDELRNVLGATDKPFNRLVMDRPPPRVPRYLQVIFLATFELLIKQNQRIVSHRDLARSIDGIGDRVMKVGGGGGNWSGEQKRANVDAVVGVVRRHFRPVQAQDDPALDSWVTQFENILSQSFTEDGLYDFKQGLYTLDGQPLFDEEAFDKILRTVSAMANHGTGAVGYVILGVADKKAHADRLMELYHIAARKYRTFYITGIEHEALAHHASVDSYYRWLIEKIKQSDLDRSLSQTIVTKSRILRYFDKAVVVLRAEAQGDPVSYKGTFYERHGTSTVTVDAAAYAGLFKRFHPS